MNHYGFLAARIGLSFVLFWFGAQQLSDPSFWIGFIPLELAAKSPLPLETVVLLNGSGELVLGALLVLGIYTRVVAALSALHLAIIALSLGLSPAGVRDWGLAAAFLSLAFTGPGRFSLDGWFANRKNKNPT